MSGAARSLGILSAEAVQDAIRRRVVAAIAVVSLLSLLGIDGCTRCAGASVVVDGQARELPQVAGATGLLTFTVLSLWCIALAGVLAAEHLRQTLEDGSAALCLARPVGRGTFAFARLAGALGIALATGVLLLGSTAALLHARTGLDPAPVLAGMAAFAAGAVTASALAMTLSLWLGRVPNVLLVFAGVGAVALANTISLAGRDPGGALGLLDRAGPPLASAVAVAVSAWVPELELAAQHASLVFRSVTWAGGSLVLLWLVFARVELGRQAP
jgi:hypothetical protein